MWLLTGLGSDTLPNSEPGNPILATTETSIATFFGQLEPYIQSKDAKIIQQAEEIGRLKETIKQLSIEKKSMYRMPTLQILQVQGKPISCYHRWQAVTSNVCPSTPL